MKTTIKYIAPWLAAAAIGAAMGLAPVASADTGYAPVSQTRVIADSAGPATPAPTPFESGASPLVPTGTDPYIPFVLGTPHHEDPAGGVDLPG